MVDQERDDTGEDEGGDSGEVVGWIDLSHIL